MKILEDLSLEVKKMWPHSDLWRENNGNIEFSLESIDGREWFHYCMAPQRIANYINCWIAAGGLNEIT